MSNILQKSWSITSELLIQESAHLGLESEILCHEKNLFFLRGNGKEILFKNNDFGGNSSLAQKMVDDKELSYILLERWGFPVARTIYMNKEDLGQFDFSLFGNWRYPLVIKPLDESHGNGVMMGISDNIELQDKLTRSFDIYSRMIIQEQIAGDECRIIVIHGEIVLATKRIPPRIQGDGISTVEKLIEQENTSNPLRGKDYDKALSFIRIDSELKDFIGREGKTLDSVLADEESLQLRGNSNIGTGGTLQEITPLLHPDIAETCRLIASKLDMQLLCIDVISSDFSRTLEETGGVILEVGGNPGFGGHREATTVNTARVLLQKIFF